MEFTIEKQVACSVARAFAVATDFEGAKAFIPTILKAEFLTPAKTGVGARFRETRKMGGKEVAAEMEIVDWIEPTLVTLRSEAFGAEYLSTFRFEELGADQTLVRFEMKATAKGLLAKGMLGMMGGMMKKEIGGDIDKMAAFLEANP